VAVGREWEKNLAQIIALYRSREKTVRGVCITVLPRTFLRYSFVPSSQLGVGARRKRAADEKPPGKKLEEEELLRARDKKEQEKKINK